MDYSAPSIPYTDLVFSKVEGLFSGSANETQYSKRMVDERMRKRGVMMTGRDAL
jgi:5'-nucleotidase